MLVRDLSGNPLFYLDGDTARDDSGKPVARRTGKDAEALTLAECASTWMSGRTVTLADLAPGDVATAATQASFAIPVQDCIADKASPIRYVTHDRGVYYPQNVAQAISQVIPVATSTGAVSEVNPGFAPTSFVTTAYALAAKIPRLISSNADFDLQAITLRFLVESLRLAAETRVAALLTTSANWAASNRVAATAKWNGGVTANPLLDMFAGLKASFLPANVLIMPETAAQYFFQNANSQAMRDYVQSGGEMPKIIFARAKTSASGVPVYVWAPTLPANVAMLRVPDDMGSIPTSMTFRWLGAGADGQMSQGVLVRKFQDQQADSDWIVCAHNDAEVIVSNQVGAIITGALA